eukprot:TRINITY_DN19502_c0_g1_i1.p1 TRINITY_DN19502_c0_g1~~TRINITY_DN19502_c0_g1_i1.p1  ORF type:complete len:378 (-),score=81.57 TRINITY_DN19502_c0_g1_i1:93-1226(-)
MAKERTAEEIAARKAKKAKKKATQACDAGESEPAGGKRAKVDNISGTASAEETQHASESFEASRLKGFRLAEQLNPRRPGFNADLRDLWKRLPQDVRKAIEKKDKSSKKRPRDENGPATGSEAPDSYPFHVDPNDHCETSPEAFADIVPFLHLLAARLGKKSESIRIWDPYYCAGASKRHLQGLGFPDVYNKCEDFYKVVKTPGATPVHDIVVTNPPYSEPTDGGRPHAARLVQILRELKAPYMVNMPEYCASAAWYGEEFPDPKAAPLLLCPYKRYHFWTPEGLRPGRNSKAHKKKDLGIRNSPFVAVWYINLEPVVSRKELLSLAKTGDIATVDTYGATAEREDRVRCRLCRRLEGLPEGRERFQGAADTAQTPQ